ncbi:hypothetical protein ACQP3L_34110, partial [Escherichia coli]
GLANATALHNAAGKHLRQDSKQLCNMNQSTYKVLCSSKNIMFQLQKTKTLNTFPPQLLNALQIP